MGKNMTEKEDSDEENTLSKNKKEDRKINRKLAQFLGTAIKDIAL